MAKPKVLEFNNHFLDHLILNSITKTDFLAKIRNTLDLTVFKSKERKILMKLIYEFYDDYKTAPKDHFYDIVQEQRDYWPESLGERCDKLVENIQEIHDSNEEYLLNSIKKAVFHFNFEEALVKAAGFIKKHNHDSAKAILLDAMKEGEKVQKSYYDFLDDQTYKDKRINGKTYKWKSLHPEIDKEIGGFNNWLVTILGPTKGGKTKWLIELTIAAALQGKKVLFVSLEMNKEEIDDALDQAIGFLGTQPGQSIEVKERKKNDWVTIKKVVPTIFDLPIVQRNRDALKKQGCKVYIVDESGNEFNYKDLISMMDFIEVQDGVIFDVIVVDYLGEMGPVRKNQTKKEKISDNCSGLKQISKERAVTVITAQQGNRAALRAKTFYPDLISDAIEPIYVSDLVIPICQTAKEEAEGVYRLYIALYRHGPKGAMIPLVRDLNVGAISLGGASERQLERIKKAEENDKETQTDGAEEY